MTYNEIRINDIEAVSFLEGHQIVLYVGPKLTWFQRLRLRGGNMPSTLLYLPEFYQKITPEMLSYNYPGVNFEDYSIESIYSEVYESLEGRVSPESMLLLKYVGDKLILFDAGKDFRLLKSYIIDRCQRKHFKIGGARLHMTKVVECCMKEAPCEASFDASDDWDFDCELESGQTLFRASMPEQAEEESGIRFSISGPSRSETIEEYRFSNSDLSFDRKMDEVAEQLRDAIKALMLKGLPAEVIKSWVDENVTLSRLRITRHFKIILADYDKEIKMGPLPKAVFLFYLRHPEGVRFSYLQDYADELMHIYSRLSVNDDPKKMRESINALTDPLSNSASEKCAAIKKAFLLQINDSIAKNYYVTGLQGGKKGISLDRSLVQWECKL